MTNRGRLTELIARMSDDDFVRLMRNPICPPVEMCKESSENKPCRQCWLNWLNSTYEEGETE